MFEILLKQLLGNVDLDAVKAQVAEFAQKAAIAFNNIADTNMRVRRIESHLFPAQQLPVATLTQTNGVRNDHNNHSDTGISGADQH